MLLISKYPVGDPRGRTKHIYMKAPASLVQAYNRLFAEHDQPPTGYQSAVFRINGKPFRFEVKNDGVYLTDVRQFDQRLIHELDVGQFEL